jgi:histone-lysine N-methyltransferase SETD3
MNTYIVNLPVGVTGIPMFFPREAIAAIEYPPVSEQVKKRCKWLFEFSKELAKLPGTPEDPFSGVVVDINALGESGPHSDSQDL